MKTNKPKYLYAAFEPRYWEDSAFTDLKSFKRDDVADDETGEAVPHRKGDLVYWWIDLETGQILDWPSNIAQAWIHYKVCDQGQYFLADANRWIVARWRGYYVPDKFLCHGDEGFGDYVILKVEDGYIQHFKTPTINEDEWSFFKE